MPRTKKDDELSTNTTEQSTEIVEKSITNPVPCDIIDNNDDTSKEIQDEIYKARLTGLRRANSILENMGNPPFNEGALKSAQVAIDLFITFR